MRRNFVAMVCALLMFSATIMSWKPVSVANTNIAKTNSTVKNSTTTSQQLLEKYVSNIYESARLQESGLSFEVFTKAITGFLNLKALNKLPQSSAMLTVVDFTKSSHDKRMWIIDVANKQLVLNTLVAHGQGSGTDMATSFSDRQDSHQSSVGFYITDAVYYGKHGRSLKLDGMDQGFNSSARAREIVVHAADYVSEGAISHLGYLGRSFGCPAVSPQVADFVINTIKDKNVLFINGDVPQYHSKYLEEDTAANFIADTAQANLASL